MDLTRGLNLAGLTTVAAFIGATLVNWNATYHTGWREGSGAAIAAVAVLAGLWSVAIMGLRLLRALRIRRSTALLMGVNVAIAALFIWGLLSRQ